MKNEMTAGQKYEAASAAVLAGEAKGMSRSTMDRRYKALFAATDALKAAGVWS